MTPQDIETLLTSDNFSNQIRGLNHLRNLDPALAFPLLKPLLNDPNPRIRYAAVSQLDPIGAVNPQESLELLRERLFNDSEIDVQSVAADVIGGLKLTEAYPDLEQTYNNTQDWLLQMSIVATLGEMGDPRSVELLKTALSSPQSLIRAAAIGALGDLGDAGIMSILLPLAEDEDWQVRYRLALTLGQLPTPEGLAALERLSQDEAEQVAATAREALAARV
ncbi:MAG: HEAT repeat domain-containing protein [Cyanobacteriota bacterium]|nr:HEAT repeat domain-containing protein [Cyanobacteriota bacterium]